MTIQAKQNSCCHRVPHGGTELRAELRWPRNTVLRPFRIIHGGTRRMLGTRSSRREELVRIVEEALALVMNDRDGSESSSSQDMTVAPDIDEE
jgi:hypothetical protein